MDKDYAAARIQGAFRVFLAKRILNAKRVAARRKSRAQRQPLDVWSMKCLQLLQRVGRGFLRRKTMKKKSKWISVRRMTRSLSRARMLPLGYNVPKNEKDRVARLRALERLCQVNAALKLQSWWREQKQKKVRALHELRMSALVFLNMKCVLIQRWWRCVLRQKQFALPPLRDQRASAESIVAAEMLRIKRDQQASQLTVLWKHNVLNDYRPIPGLLAPAPTVTGLSVVATPNPPQRDGSPSSPPTTPAASPLVVQSPTLSIRSYNQRESANRAGNATHATDGTVSHRQQAVPFVVRKRHELLRRHSPGRRPSRIVPPSRCLSAMDVAVQRGVQEWNGSTSIGVPSWCAAPR